MAGTESKKMWMAKLFTTSSPPRKTNYNRICASKTKSKKYMFPCLPSFLWIVQTSHCQWNANCKYKSECKSKCKCEYECECKYVLTQHTSKSMEMLLYCNSSSQCVHPKSMEINQSPTRLRSKYKIHNNDDVMLCTLPMQRLLGIITFIFVSLYCTACIKMAIVCVFWSLAEIKIYKIQNTILEYNTCTVILLSKWHRHCHSLRNPFKLTGSNPVHPLSVCPSASELLAFCVFGTPFLSCASRNSRPCTATHTCRNSDRQAQHTRRQQNVEQKQKVVDRQSVNRFFQYLLQYGRHGLIILLRSCLLHVRLDQMPAACHGLVRK